MKPIITCVKITITILIDLAGQIVYSHVNILEFFFIIFLGASVAYSFIIFYASYFEHSPYYHRIILQSNIETAIEVKK